MLFKIPDIMLLLFTIGPKMRQKDLVLINKFESMCDAVMETTEMAVSLAVTSNNPIEDHCKNLIQSI